MLAVDWISSEVDAAAGLLDRREGDGVARASEVLNEVHAALSDLIADDSVLSSPEAGWLLSLRDELSVHLSAAATLTSLQLPARASDVLHRAVTTMRSGVGRRLAERAP